MDETTRSVIDRITVRYDRPMPIPVAPIPGAAISGGHQCTVFYDCARLSPNELARLAAEATGHLSEDAFDVALGIAYNGIFFAAAIAGGRQVAILKADGDFAGPALKGQKIVIVDDVVFSGARVERAEQKALAAGATVIGYACIVDRSDGQFGSQKKPLWSAYQTNMI